MPKLALPVLFCALLGGCIPMDGMVRISGTAPAATSCLVGVAPAEYRGRPKEYPVRGDFNQAFVIQPSLRGHRATLTCDGTVVATRAFKYGRDVGFDQAIDLGGSESEQVGAEPSNR